MSVDLSNTDIQVAIISGLFGLVSTLLATIAAALIGSTIANRQKLKEKLNIAIQDIEFLLEVEDIHCEYNKQHFNQSRKNLVREEARRHLDSDFSGKFTPGVVRARERFR